MERRVVTFRFVLGRRELRGILALSLLCLLVEQPESESLTITTYYPAAYGVYEKLTTSQQTILAREAGYNVGIGVTNPTTKLQVWGNAEISGTLLSSGAIRLANLSTDPPGSDGMLYYNTSSREIRAFQYEAWKRTMVGFNSSSICAAASNAWVPVGYIGRVQPPVIFPRGDNTKCFAAVSYYGPETSEGTNPRNIGCKLEGSELKMRGLQDGTGAYVSLCCSYICWDGYDIIPYPVTYNDYPIVKDRTITPSW